MRKILTILLSFFLTTASYSFHQPAPLSYPFPIEHYNQNPNNWIPSSSLTHEPRFSPTVQKAQFQNFKNHFFLPWDDDYITEFLKLPFKQDQIDSLDVFDKTKIDDQDHVGRMSCDPSNSNFNKPYPDNWIQDLKTQINLAQFDNKNPTQAKGIALDNLHVRALPTEDRFFYNCNLPGEGDSFDYLQMSVLWAGTPVYIIGESVDQQWYFVRSPDVRGWVKSRGIKKVSGEFIQAWKKNAENGLVAINSPINTKTLIISDEATQTKRFAGYMGAVFPLAENVSDSQGFHILIPTQESDLPVTAYLSTKDASLMPLLSTPANFIQVINNLIGRPYGWGSVDSDNPANFLNDCSQELKSIFTVFGVWLPRNSSAQVNKTIANPHFTGANNNMILGVVDNSYPTGAQERIAKLVKEANAHAFTTIVNIKGHVFLYLGNYPNPDDQTSHLVPLTYQNVWGLKPVSRANFPDGRYVIGKAVLFPLLLEYPEKYPLDNRLLDSLASRPDFIVAYLDQLPISGNLLMRLGDYLGMHEPKLNLSEEWSAKFSKPE